MEGRRDGQDGLEGLDGLDGLEGLDGQGDLDRFKRTISCSLDLTKGGATATPLETIPLRSSGPRTSIIIGRGRIDVFPWIESADVLPRFLVEEVLFGGEE